MHLILRDANLHFLNSADICIIIFYAYKLSAANNNSQNAEKKNKTCNMAKEKVSHISAI